MRNSPLIIGPFTYYELICDASTYRYRYVHFFLLPITTFHFHGIFIDNHRQEKDRRGRCGQMGAAPRQHIATPYAPSRSSVRSSSRSKRAGVSTYLTFCIDRTCRHHLSLRPTHGHPGNIGTHSHSTPRGTDHHRYRIIETGLHRCIVRARQKRGADGRLHTSDVRSASSHPFTARTERDCVRRKRAIARS